MTSETIAKINEVQDQHKEWAFQNFGANTAENQIDPVLGVIEEIGEFSHSFLKRKQGIRGTPEEHQANMRDALADVSIYLMHFCTKAGVRFVDVLLRAESNYVSEHSTETELIRLTCGVKHLQVAYLMSIEDAVFVDAVRHQITDFMALVYRVANKVGVDLTATIIETWESIVSKRDWKKNSATGAE